MREEHGAAGMTERVLGCAAQPEFAGARVAISSAAHGVCSPLLKLADDVRRLLSHEMLS